MASELLDRIFWDLKPALRKDAASWLATGDEKHVAAVSKQKKGTDVSCSTYLTAAFPRLAKASDEQRRLLRLIAVLVGQNGLQAWLNAATGGLPEGLNEELLADLRQLLAGLPKHEAQLAGLVLECCDDKLLKDGQPTFAGRFILSQSDKTLAAAKSESHAGLGLLKLLLSESVDRVEAVWPALVKYNRYWTQPLDQIAKLCLARDANRFLPLVVEARDKLKDEFLRCQTAIVLSKFDPAFRSQARESLVRALATSRYHDEEMLAACRWLVESFGPECVPDVAKAIKGRAQGYGVEDTFEVFVEKLGIAAAPILQVAAAHKDVLMRFAGVRSLIALADPQFHGDIHRSLATLLAEKENHHVANACREIGKWRGPGAAESLWPVTAHKSKPVREAAARALGALGDDIFSKAQEFLLAKKADQRSAAVTILSVLGTPQALAALEARLDDEADEDVRDQMLLALDAAWKAAGKEVTPEQIEQRIARAAESLKEPLAKWIGESKLPPLRDTGGHTLSQQQVRYLLFRQMRCKEMRPDVEGAALLARIDRKTSGDFAVALLNQFLASKMDAGDRWAMTLAGLLGDDRIVPPLMGQIRKWVDTNRGKLAEYAAQAIALLGTDPALCAIDSLSIRYRVKQKNIGAAAAAAFQEAAERLGISPDELGDRVVPWLGFEPGKPRLLEKGDTKIEVRVGLDWKLEFRDLGKGKKIASMPLAMGPEAKAEMKDLQALLKEVLKGQLPRLENLMVRQYRWPIARWRELYLGHPILFPFAVRLVWGWYDESGKLSQTFRALEDQTLTAAADEAWDLPSKGTVGIVHPLELSVEQLAAWQTHVADYELQSPFPQLGRTVLRCDEPQKGVKFGKQFNGAEVNAMTFKGRADRLGWTRGSVVDGGCIEGYRKCFPGAGADVFLSLDGMYMGIDMYSSITLQQFYFVKGGSVRVGSYLYDGPGKEDDERLIPFGQVPPIVYSEAVGDLQKISGKSEAAGSSE